MTEKRKSGGVEALDVLFVGNSFTARNDVPGLVARLAAARGRRLGHRLVSAGGASLRMHWNRGEAREAIASARYDYVVLQEQSTLPVKNAARMRENVLLFDEAIKESGARTALYMTWARAGEPQNQKVIADAYTSIGAEIGATVVPVGLAWERFLSRHASPALHDRDGSHPTLAGSYLAACVFYFVLFGESPEGIDVPVEGLGEDDAALLRAAALDAAVTRDPPRRPTRRPRSPGTRDGRNLSPFMCPHSCVGDRRGAERRRARVGDRRGEPGEDARHARVAEGDFCGPTEHARRDAKRRRARAAEGDGFGPVEDARRDAKRRRARVAERRHESSPPRERWENVGNGGKSRRDG